MKKLLKYLKDYKKECVLSPLFKMLEALFELFVPMVVAAIIDNGISGYDKPYILRMSLVLVVLGFVGLAFSVTAQYYAAKAAVGFSGKVRHALFSHIQTLSYKELDIVGTSTLITRITSDMNQVQNGVNLTLRLLLRSPFVVFGAMIAAFFIDPQAGLLFAAAILILSVVVFAIMLFSIPLYNKVQKALDKVMLKTRETLSGVRVIRAFCKEQEEIEEFEKTNNELNRLQRYVGKISALMNPLTFAIINLAIIALIQQGAIRVNSGIISQGAVVALYNYMSQILVELIKLANLIITITKAIASGDRIEDIFETETSIKNPENPASPVDNTEYVVEFKNVYLKYASASDYSLCDISFSVKKGETVGIIGGTGSGKTSLVNMIPRFYDADKGSVSVFGTDVKNISQDTLRQKIAVVPQKAVLFSGSIRDNLKWGKGDATDEELLSAISSAQAEEIVLSKEGGLDYKLEQEGKNLSGGQKQRLTIARALVKNPDILILDDSASALDFATDAALRKELKKLDGDKTIFIVSQRTSSIQFADKIIVIEDGKIDSIGTHDELLKISDVYREIYMSQFKEENSL